MLISSPNRHSSTNSVSSLDTQLDKLNTFDGKVTYDYRDGGLAIKFNAQQIKVESVVDYAFHTLRANDFRISEISIEDVVKSILKKQNEKV